MKPCTNAYQVLILIPSSLKPPFSSKHYAPVYKSSPDSPDANKGMARYVDWTSHVPQIMAFVVNEGSKGHYVRCSGGRPGKD